MRAIKPFAAALAASLSLLLSVPSLAQNISIATGGTGGVY